MRGSNFKLWRPLARATALLLGTALLQATTSHCRAADSDDSLQERIGLQRGICVILGERQATTAIRVAKSSELLIYVQSSDADDVKVARRAADEAGLLGSRLYIEQGDLRRIHLADNIADVVVLNESVDAATEPLKSELLRVLRPGGRAIGGGRTLVKPTPLGTSEWSHPYHSPDNNPQSQDQVARGPFLTQFTAEPWYATMPQMTVISGGRIFKVFGNRASARPQWPVMNTMICMSAHNGMLLWKRPISPSFMLHRNTMIATPELLYFADDKSCKRIDAATGEVRDEIVVPKELSDGPVWKWMSLVDGVLYALVGEQEPEAAANKGDRFRGAGWPWWKIDNYKFGFGRTLLAIDPESKKVLWHHREEEPIDSRATCMTRDRLFFYCHPSLLACLEAKTGKVVWKSRDQDVLAAIGEHDAAQHWMKGFASQVYMKCSEDGLYFAGPQRKHVVGVSAKNGKLLWKRDGGNSQLVLRHDGLYALGEGTRNGKSSSFKLDALSGEVLATFPSRDRCTRATGCVDAIFTRGGKGGSTAAFNVSSGEPRMDTIGPMRPACQDGVVVAHGQLYWGPWKCRCDGTQIGVMCLGTAGGYQFDTEATEDSLQRFGSSTAPVAAFPVDDSDWPTYRRDNARSTRRDVDLPNEVQLKWTFSPPTTSIATAPVAVGGSILVSGSDGAVRALDASTGKTRWTAYTGGEIKFPPSIAEGRAYVGSGDGWVHCLEAASGKNLWRFRAAPLERKVPIYGTLQSTWPVAAGVLVENGVAYAAAGMFNYDGAHFFALDAKSGEVRWQKHTTGQLGGAPENGAGVQSHMLLHGDRLYLSGGGQAPLISFRTSDGKCDSVNGGRGKDLFVFKGQVRATGYPLFWRQEDLHHIENAVVETSAGYVTVTNGQLALVGDKQDDKGKPIAVWASKPVQDVAALAVGKDVVIVSGVDHAVDGETVATTASLSAVRLSNGKTIWKETLPAAPVSWGIAIDRQNQIVVSLRDGRVLCFAAR